MGFQLPTINSIFLLVLQDEDESPPEFSHCLPTSKNVRISPVETAPRVRREVLIYPKSEKEFKDG